MMLVISQLVLTACSESIGSVRKPILDPPPPGLVKSCDLPVELPVRPLTQLEVESWWIFDRNNLVTCSERHDAATEFFKDRDGRISGNDW